MKIKFNIKKFCFMSVALLAASSCIQPLTKVAVFNNKPVSNSVRLGAQISHIQIAENKITLQGKNLNEVVDFKIEGVDEKFNIVAQTSSKLVAEPKNNIALKLNSLMNFILSDAQASATIPVHINLEVPGAQMNDFLQFNGTAWGRASINGLTYKGLWDPTSGTDPYNAPQSGDYYIVSKNGTHAINGISTWTKGDWVVYADTATGWQKIDNSTGTFSLTSLSDVQINSPAANQVLTWNGTKWINQTFSVPAENDPSVGAVTLNKWCRGNGSQIVCDQDAPAAAETDPSVKSFAKNDLPVCASGEVLKSNGSVFSCVTDQTGGGGGGGTVFSGTASKIVVTNTSGELAASSVDSSMLTYLSGTTGNIQSQIDAIVDWSTPGLQTIDPVRLNLGVASAVVVTDASGGLTHSTSVDSQELGYLDGVTSNIQSQLDAKGAAVTKTSDLEVKSIKIYGANTSNYVELRAPALTGNTLLQWPANNGSNNQVLKTDGGGNLFWANDNSGDPAFSGTASRLIVSSASGALTSSSVTATESSYLSGVSSNIQTQLDGKQAVLSSSTSLLGNLVRIYNGTNYVELKSPSLSGNVLLTMPSALGSDGQVLKTNASGELGWISPSSLSVDWSGAGAETIYPSRLNLGAGNGSKVVVTDTSARMIASTTTTTELGYLSGVSSNVQTQLDNKVNTSSFIDWTSTGVQTIAPSRMGLTTCSSGQVLTFNGTSFACVADSQQPTLTANRVITTNSSGALTVSSVTDTVLGYLSSVSSNVQTQLDNVVAAINTINSSAALSSWILKNDDFNAASNRRYLVNTTTTDVVVVLPATPVFGDVVTIMDKAGTFHLNNIVVQRNGQKIMGLAEDMTVDTQNISFDLVYTDSTDGWRIH